MPGTVNTPALHVAVFGRPNSGKSTLINALAERGLANVSPQAGTTTAPTYLNADILPIGRVTFVDTPGLCAGTQANCKQFAMINKLLHTADIALLTLDAREPNVIAMERHLIRTCEQRDVPIFPVITRSDEVSEENVDTLSAEFDIPPIITSVPNGTSALNGTSVPNGSGIAEIRVLLNKHTPVENRDLVADLVDEGLSVLFVTRNDPGDRRKRMESIYCRLVKEALDAGTMPLLVKEANLPRVMSTLFHPPTLIIADVEQFDRLARMVPSDIPLTTLSVLAAREKGDLRGFIEGIASLKRLKPGDRVLIVEACAYRPLSEQADYLSLPTILRTFVGGPLRITTASGPDAFPESLRRYQLVIHCAACCLDRPEMLRRQALAQRQGVPLVNHALLQTYLSHSLSRALAPLRQNGALPEDPESAADEQRARVVA